MSLLLRPGPKPWSAEAGLWGAAEHLCCVSAPGHAACLGARTSVGAVCLLSANRPGLLVAAATDSSA